MSTLEHKQAGIRFLLGCTFLLFYMSGIKPTPLSIALLLGAPFALLALINIQKIKHHNKYFIIAILSLLLLRTILYDFSVYYFAPTFILILATSYIIVFEKNNGSYSLNRITLFITTFFALSFLLFVVTLISQTGLLLRDFLYSGIDASKYVGVLGLDSTHFRQGGLSYFLFTFGYQIAGGTMLLIGMAIVQSGKLKVFFIISTIIAITTLFVAGQRSAIVGVGTGAILLFPLFKIKRIGFAVLLTVVLLIGSFYTVSKTIVFRGENNTSMGRLLGDNPANDDILYRLTAQVVGAKLILNYPLGIRNANISFSQEVFNLTGYYIPSIHNGYLGVILSYGWLFGAIIILVCYKIIRMGLSTLKLSFTETEHKIEIIVYASLISVMVNALFHNASIFTFSSESLVLLFLYSAWYDNNRRIGLDQ